MGVLAVTGLGAGAFLAPQPAEAYQDVSTPTGVFITVGNPPDGTNVRSGPHSINYGPPIGRLNPGDTAPAIGKTAAGEWIQIQFPAGPNGIGWVYSANVEVSPGFLQIVEPPPTPAPLMTATIDLTLAAAFNIQPTPTRMPTFTPPPPLEIPQYPEENTGGSFGAFGVFILVLGLIGGAGLLMSFIFRK